jgi:TetR/AcrR family transcriptional regulator, transcriptional repressor for nem operon
MIELQMNFDRNPESSRGNFQAMGHSQADKARTHARIVELASQRFREHGLDGIGVADLMKDAGVTAGGFYKHFASRDALVAEAVAAAFGSWDRMVGEAAAKNDGLVTFAGLLEQYLIEHHTDNPSDGCTFAALAPDLARSDPRTKAVANEQLNRSIDQLTSLIGTDDGSSRQKAIVALSAMVGAMSLSRLAEDKSLSREILQATLAAIRQLA